MGMGQLIDGTWTDEEATERLAADGSYKRPNSKIRSWVTEDGSPGPSGEDGFKAEAGRYHLYISLSCPFAHRAAIMRRLKKLEGVVSISVAAGRTSQSWVFDNDSEDFGDAILGKDYLHEVYVVSHRDFTGRVTVPVLWDKQAQRHRQQRILRDHPHVQFGLQCLHSRPNRLLSASACGRRSTS